jgi:hypothetical protein
MIQRIAFIHTVAMLVERFPPRFQSELPDADCFHMLDESVLQDLIRQQPSRAVGKHADRVHRGNVADRVIEAKEILASWSKGCWSAISASRSAFSDILIKSPFVETYRSIEKLFPERAA